MLWNIRPFNYVSFLQFPCNRLNSLKSILVRYSALKTKGLKSGEYNEVVKALKSVGINAIGSDKKLEMESKLYLLKDEQKINFKS